MDNLNKNGGIPLTAQSVSVQMFQLETQSGSTTTNVHASNAMHNVVESSATTALSVNDSVSEDADLTNFLSRKVQIDSRQWAVGFPLNVSINPWNLFLSNTAVSNKLQNYQLLKGDLKVTFYVNGTPFHAGMLLASYSYMSVANEIFTAGGDTQIVTRSQRPHLFLNVSTNKSGCMCLPFFYPISYLSLTDPLFDAANIGTLALDSIADLVQINAGTDTVTITVFAEMVNVKLTGPTMNPVALSGNSEISFSMFDLEPQAGKDEYDQDGVISGPSSAIASYAGHFTSIPYIAPFALATQMGASAIAGIASLFGYSKPIQLDDTKPMRNFPVGNLALTEGADLSQKLTVTGKAELSIDPRIVELPETDEMTLSFLTKKETYVTQFTWAVSDVVSDTIFAMDIDPMAERRGAIAGGTQIIPTCLSFASRPFSAWSGSLKYRFQVIASQYHRGRLAIIYDPTGPLVGDPYNTTFNTILDLEEARDFTVEFKWQQDRAYCFITTDNARTFHTETAPAARASTRETCNGIFYVRVVNELVVPDGVSDVQIAVSISAGDDFELVNPKGSTLQVFPYAPVAQSCVSDVNFDMFDLEPQSSSTEIVPENENAPEDVDAPIVVTSGVITHIDEKPLIYYGERVNSFRQLLKRYCFFRAIAKPTGSTVTYSQNFNMKAMPAVGGFDPNAVDTTLATTPYWFVSNNYINYLKGAYAGWKGSIRWKFCPQIEMATLTAIRNTGNSQRAILTDYRPFTNHTLNVGDTVSETAAWRLEQMESVGGGAVTTQCRTMDALEVEIPYTTNLRFSKVHGEYLPVNTNTIANGYPGGDTFSMIAVSAHNNSNVNVDAYVAAGEDFSLFGFVGAPVVYSATVPSPST